MRARASVREDEAYLREVYEADAGSLADNAPRASAHILIVVDDVAGEGSALEQIQDVAERLADGEEFAALAQEFSQDPGSAPLGGDLGMMAKGSFDSAFEDTLWSLSEVGDVSQPVRSEFGYHLIRLSEIGDVEIPSFAQDKERILAELRDDAAAEAYDNAIEELEQRAFEERYSLTETATALGLAVQKAENISQNRDSTLLREWQLAGIADVIESLFSSEGLDGENSAVLSLDEDRVAVVRASDYAPAEQMTLEDVRTDIVDALKLEAALSQIESDEQSTLTQLLEGASVSDVAASLGKRWETRELITRGGVTPQGSPEVPQFVLREAFVLARPEPGEKSVGTSSSSEGSALIVVTRVIAGDVDATAQVLIDQLEEQVVARDQQLEFAAFFAAAGQSVGVDRID
jgi:peptidyl-prolyl cis-trans isomerase D